jgi:hypothetical protein
MLLFDSNIKKEYRKGLMPFVQHYSKVLISIFFISTALNTSAQDIEPRRWSSLPLKSDIFGAGYIYSFGDVLFDPVLQAEDVSVNVSTLILSYIKPFKLGKKLARVDMTLPYNFMLFEGKLSGNPASVYRNGFGDSRLRFSINFSGPPPGNASELQAYYKAHPVYTTFGASVAITFPTGQYFNEKLINIGQNQIIIRPQIGMVHNWRDWSYELTGSVFFFSNNNNFFGDTTRKQDPIFAFQTHLIKRFDPKLWASISLSYGIGGESIVNNISSADLRTNLLSAGSVGYKISKLQSMKLVYLNSATLKEIGSNTHSFIFGWSQILL